MSNEYTIDKRQVRRAFGRAAASYDAAAVLQREVSQRMMERLDYIKHTPKSLLDVGSGTGAALQPLAARYPQATMVSLDLAMPMLLAQRAKNPWWRRLPGLRGAKVMQVCADMEQIPLQDGCMDMIWSNFALQWANDIDQAFTEMRRVLAPGGLLMFSTFGPDTLKELREGYAQIDGYTHTSRFADMHDIGDGLVRAGFVIPVMDVEHFTLTYPDVKALMRDLKAIGAHNATAGRLRGLQGKGRLQQLAAYYETLRQDGRLPLTYEVVYGHAWAGEIAPGHFEQPGKRTIRLHPQGGNR